MKKLEQIERNPAMGYPVIEIITGFKDWPLIH